MEIIQIHVAGASRNFKTSPFTSLIDGGEFGIFRHITALLAQYHIRSCGIPTVELRIPQANLLPVLQTVTRQVRKGVFTVSQQFIPTYGSLQTISGIVAYVRDFGTYETAVVRTAFRESAKLHQTVFCAQSIGRTI